MNKFENLVNKYTAIGVSKENIEYAISSVKDGTKREFILESLTADYRGMEYRLANSMLEEMYKINGGEFKKENRNGYLYGIFFLMIGGACSYYIYSVFQNGGTLVRPILVTIGAISGVGVGLLLILISIFGKYRDNMEPFDN